MDIFECMGYLNYKTKLVGKVMFVFVFLFISIIH